jgi:hypothetical protein
MRRGLISIIAILLNVLVAAQAPSKFIATYGGNGVDIGYSIKELLNQQYIIVGSTSSYDAQGTDIVLLKLDGLGNTIWLKKFGGVGLDVGKAIVVNPVDSSYYIAGYSNSNVNSGYDVYCLQVSKNGTLIWENRIGGFDWDFGSDLKIGTDGNLIVVGKTYNPTFGKEDGLIIKLNSTTGSVIWTKNYGTVEDDDFVSIATDGAGSIFVAGNTVRGLNDSQFWLLTMDQNGDTLYTKTFGHAGRNDLCYDMMLDKQQNLVLCGSFDTSSLASGKNVGYIEKVNIVSLAAVQFTLGGAGPNDRFLSVANRKSNNDYCFSRSVLYGAQLTNVQPILFIDDFTYLQSTTYGGFEFDEAFEIIPTSDNGYAMIGYSKSYNAGKDQDIYFLKLDSTFLSAKIVVGLDVPIVRPESKTYFYGNTLYSSKSEAANDRKFKMFDIDGSLILDETLEQGKFELSEEIEKGIYFVTFDDGETLKILVK